MTLRKILAVCLACISTATQAEVTLPRLFTDGAILQREKPVTLWGWAEPGERIRIKLNDRVVAAVTSNQSRWQVSLPAQQAGGPFKITVVGENQINLSDIYFGDVWVASGQSNMVLPMERVKERYMEEIRRANSPLIRQFTVSTTYQFGSMVEDYRSGHWQKADSEQNIKAFSAVAYFFAHKIQQETGVPIGILQTAVGGSPIQAWMSEDSLTDFPDILEQARRYQDPDVIKAIQHRDQQQQQLWHTFANKHDLGMMGAQPWYDPALADDDWRPMQIPGSWEPVEGQSSNGVYWLRKTFHVSNELAGKPAKLMLGRLVDADTTYINGEYVGNITYQYPPRRYTVPAGLLKAGQNQITVRLLSHRGQPEFVANKPYWLQVGEEKIDLTGQWKWRRGLVSDELPNAEFIQYKPTGLFNAMLAPALDYPIRGVIWYQGESNSASPTHYADYFSTMVNDWRERWQQGDFPFLYVQLANFMARRSTPTDTSWARLREQQTQGLLLSNTAMAVAIDVGEWNDIHPLNKRAVGERLAFAALAKSYDVNVPYQGPVVTQIKQEAHQLRVIFSHTQDGLVSADNQLDGFAIAGEDKQFVWAKAHIEGNAVILSADTVSKPLHVRYAWGDNPAADLYDSTGLPARPFRGSAN